MRPLIVVLVLLAFGIATLTTVLFSRLLSHREEPAQVAAVVPPPVDIAEIIVAAKDLKMGDILKADDIRYVAWPAAAMDARYVRREKDREAKDGFVGAIARRPLFAGEPMTPEIVYRRIDAGVMAGLLSPGMRAVSIPVTATSGVAGFVLPNDHVDVLLDQDVHAAVGQVDDHPGRNNILHYATEAILSDVRVVAVDDKLSKPDAAANQLGKTVTVEVSEKDAEILVLAGRMGELVLALRSVTADPKPIVAAGYIGDVAASSALKAALRPDIISSVSTGTVRINRGGAITTQSFAF
jgi:pilus assembly protein CpaB